MSQTRVITLRISQDEFNRIHEETRQEAVKRKRAISMNSYLREKLFPPISEEKPPIDPTK